MCPFCKSDQNELGKQTCSVCAKEFAICVPCLWAVNDVCSFCGKAKCPECRARNATCQRVALVAREGKWERISINTFQPPAIEVGVMTWNINHFENLPAEKALAINLLFERHAWLDVLVLQEINATATLTISGGGLTMEKGPKITSLSRGKKPKSSKAKTFWDDDVKQWVTPRQQEYYPIIFRDSTVQYVRSTYLSHSKRNDESALRWTTAEELRGKYAPCRPVIVHSFLVQNEPVNIAVVHTTPEGAGLGRKGEYLQVLPMLEHVSKAGGFWIIAGDYYLDPESTMQSNTDVKNRDVEQLFRTKIEELGLEFAISVSATNQSTLQHGLPVIWDRVKRVVGGEERVVLNKRADFFLYNKAFVRAEAGVASPRGGLLTFDPSHHALNWWRQTSDHAPVGAILCSSKRSRKLDEKDDEKWLQPGVLEKAQQQLGELYREAAYMAAYAVREMVALIRQHPSTKLTKSPVAKRFCCLLAEVSWTWGDWVGPCVEQIAVWKQQTIGVTHRQAIHFADKQLLLTEEAVENLKAEDDVTGYMVEAIRNGRHALFALDLDCVDFDLTDEDDEYDDVELK